MARGLNPEFSAVRKPGFKSQPTTHTWGGGGAAHSLANVAVYPAVMKKLEGEAVLSSCRKTEAARR